MSEQEKIQLFEDQKIRTAWDTEKEEWYFSVTDVISVLTGQQTARGASNYWAKLKQRLKEEKGQGGAYYCSLPSFRDSYRLVTRMLERSGQSAYLMLCSLTDGKGHPLEKPEKLELLSEELQEYDPALPAKRRFLYQIQSVTVSGTSDRNEQRELWTDI